MSDSSASSSKTTYQESGVDIELADQMIRSWLPQIKRTSRPGQLGSPLGFSALFEIPEGYDKPVLVSSTDGVGTKLKIAFEMNRHDTVGIDLVAMCVNDVIVQGAEPLYFLDYLATGKLDEKVMNQVISGIVQGCEIANVALIGGETAEMPGMYSVGEYDLAGFSVGIIEKSKIIDGSRVAVGDVIIGIESTGIHSNGFSLVRKLLSDQNISLSIEFDGSILGDILLTPTRIYVDVVMKMIQSGSVHAMAHITGGGILGNLQRVIREGLTARLDRNSWVMPPVFNWIQRVSNLSEEEMLMTFNCGIGMAAIVSPQSEAAIRAELDAMEIASFRIGTIAESVDSGNRIDWQ